MLQDMKIHLQEKANLKKETLQLRYLMEHSCFNINEFKDNPEDISFFTGFSDYQTMMLCYDIIKNPAKNLSYGVHERKVFDAQSNSSELRRPWKLTTFQEFLLELMKLRLGLFDRDLAHRFRVPLTSVSVIFRTWIWFFRTELQCLIFAHHQEKCWTWHACPVQSITSTNCSNHWLYRLFIQDEFASVGALLTIPANSSQKKKQSKTKKMAFLRVHIERCIERIKNWHILDSKIPITLAPFASDIFIVIWLHSQTFCLPLVHSFNNRAMLQGLTLTVLSCYRHLCLNTKWT